MAGCSRRPARRRTSSPRSANLSVVNARRCAHGCRSKAPSRSSAPDQSAARVQSEIWRAKVMMTPAFRLELRSVR
jgi:hypothetical protein